MSELKVYHCNEWHNEYTEFYIKSEADKVIAGLEETLKNSRNARKYWRKEYLIEYKECSHQKYKRCLAMAEMLEHVCPMTNRKAKQSGEINGASAGSPLPRNSRRK